MKYYEFEVHGDNFPEEKLDSTDGAEQTSLPYIGLPPRECSGRFKQCFRQSGQRTFIFLSTASLGEGIRGGVLTKDCVEEEAVAGVVYPCLCIAGDSAGAVLLTECDSDTFIKNLLTAREKRYVVGLYNLFKYFPPLDELYDYREHCIWTRSRRYTEKLACTQMLQQDGGLGMSALAAELERIREKPAIAGVKGIPVHYILCSDNHKSRTKAAETLITALFENNRISLRRYCEIDISNLCEDDLRCLDAVFETYVDGAIVFHYDQAPHAESGTADTSEEILSTVCQNIMTYRNKVQIVFCFPLSEEKEREYFCRHLGGLSFITVDDALVPWQDVRGYLTGKARDWGCTAPEALLEKVAEKRQYSYKELDNLFDIWLSNYIKTEVYPQYANILAVEETALQVQPQGSAYESLQRMVGLQSAKRVITDAINYHKAQTLLRSRGLKSSHSSMHMVFTGNPGTAKTSVARLFAEIMRDNKVLSGGQMVEVGRGNLVGKYVGWTAAQVKKKFQQARGGVLFIDEAYSLVDDRDGSFGDECINTIVQEMENNRDSVAVIFAGYPREMEKFLQKNPGLRSRIAFYVRFEDYTCDEFCAIARLMAEDRQMTLADGTQERLAQIYNSAAGCADFGNGRFARNLIEQAAMHQATRLMAGNPAALSDRELTTLTAVDFAFEAENCQRPGQKIGFCV